MIESLIKQKTFKTDYEKASINLLYTANMLCDFHQNFLKQFNITPQQYNVLRILRGQQPNPVTIRLIKERMIDRNSDVSRMVERLRKSELIERVISKNDKRAVDILISSKGLELLAEIDNYYDTLSSPLRVLNSSEVASLNQSLNKLLKGLDKKLN